jgi:3'(2'), 5'-bisphosphate nucleotidase
VQVAEGLAHLYPRLAPTCEWDTAAAHVIVEEAGGTVVRAGACDNKGNALEDWRTALAAAQPVLYNKEDVLNPFFVVFGRRVQRSASASAAGAVSTSGDVPQNGLDGPLQ